MDFTRATELTDEVAAEVDDCFKYHQWTDSQVEAGERVRAALGAAVKVIIANAPPCPDRSHAIRLCRDARMWGNAAITSHGKY